MADDQRLIDAGWNSALDYVIEEFLGGDDFGILGVGHLRGNLTELKRPVPQYKVVAENAEKAYTEGTLKTGNLLKSKKGHIVFELLEAEHRGSWARGRLKDTRTGKSAGWKYLDQYQIVEQVSD
jgi:hypothetical protein